MKTKTAAVLDSRKIYAAQSAQMGLINVSDLSLLTGVPQAILTAFAKKGMLRSYAEYHGKRFFNLKEIVNWLIEPGFDAEAKDVIRTNLQAELKSSDCPFSLKKVISKTDGTSAIDVIWKMPEAA